MHTIKAYSYSNCQLLLLRHSSLCKKILAGTALVTYRELFRCHEREREKRGEREQYIECEVPKQL